MAKNIGYGSSISTSTGVIGQVESISFGGIETNDVDVTTLDSSDAYRDFVPGLIDPGDLTITITYDKILASHKALSNHLNGRTVLDGWSVAFTGSTTDPDTFSGYVNSLSREVPLDDKMTATFGVKVTGDPGLTIT